MKTSQESLLLIGVGAISTGIERLDVNIPLGLILVVIGAGLIYLRGYLKTT